MRPGNAQQTIVGCNLQTTLSVTNGLFVFPTSNFIFTQLRVKFQRLYEGAIPFEAIYGLVIY